MEAGNAEVPRESDLESYINQLSGNCAILGSM